MAVHPMPTPARQPDPEPEVELHRGALRPDRAPVIAQAESDLNRTHRPEQLEGSDDDAMITALAASHDLHGMWEHLAARTRQIAGDARLSTAAQIDDSQKLAAEALPRAHGKAHKALKTLEARRAELQAELAAPPRGTDAAQAAEIRAVVRGMTPAQRSSLLQEAIREGDQLLCAAIYGAHPVLTGLNPEMRALLAADAGKIMHPEAAATLAAVERAITHIRALLASWERRARESFNVRLAPRRQLHEAIAPDLIEPAEEPEAPAA